MKRVHRSVSLPLLLLVTFAGRAAAQEGFRTETVWDRPFEFSDTYFLDVLSYLHPEEWQDEWDASRSGYRMTVGSVRTNEFYLDQQAKLDFDAGKWFHGRFQAFQREDFDSRYVRILTGGDIDLTDRIAVGAFTTLLPTKEQIDIGYSVSYLVDRTNYLSLSLLTVDALLNRKAETGDELSGEPYTLKLQGSLRPIDGWILAFRLGRDFPLRLRFRSDRFEFVHRKTFYGTRLEGRLSERWTVVVRLEGENGERVREYDDPADPENLDQERDHFRFRLELRRRFLSSLLISAGFDYLYLYEASRYPGDPARDHLIKLREATLYGGVRIPIPFAREFAFRPMIYLGRFDDRDLFPNAPKESDRVRGFVGKFGAAIEYVAPDRLRILVNATFDLHEFGFGGGNVQVQWVF